MKLLYFGDKHERVTAPENRLEDDQQYRETQATKTREIISIGKQNQVDGYIQPGDFLDSPNPPLDYVADVMRLWTGDEDSDDLEKFQNDMPPLIGVVGNHELFGNNIKTLSKTMIGFLNKLGMIHFATKQKPYFFTTEDGATVAITGTHYHLDIDKPEHLDDYIVEEKLADFHIHMVHGYLTDKSKGSMFHHTVIDQIKHTKADLTISGHDHIGFPLTEVDGKMFVNPGAIPRMSNDLKEIKRIPQVMLLDITKANGIKVEMIPLKTASKGDVVLNRRKIVERKKREDRLEEFKKAVRDAGVKKSTDITQIIRDLADLKGLSLDVRDDVIDRISKKQEEMDFFMNPVVNEAYVLRIVLENFQSHGFTEIECSKGLNIFVGESGQGKTSILRGFEWVYAGKPAGKRIIKKGEDYAKVTVYLSNGYTISRFVERKSNGKNGYIIVDPSTGVEEYHNTKILPEVQKILGYTPFVIDNDLQFNLNFMKQGSGWFLIGDQYSAPVKAKIIGGIYGTQYTDAVSRELDAEEKKANEVIREVQAELVGVEEQIRSYDHLDALGDSIENIEKLLKEIEGLNTRKEKIVSLVSKRKRIESVIHENEEIIAKMEGLDRAILIYEQSKVKLTQRNQLANLVTKRIDLEVKYRLLQESLEALKDIDQASTVFQEVVALHRQSGDIRQSLLKRQKIVTQIAEENEIILRTEGIENASKLSSEIQALAQRHKELLEKVDRAKRLEATRKEVTIKLALIDETVQHTAHLVQVAKLLAEIKEDMETKAKIEKVLDSRKRLKNLISVEDSSIKKQNNEMAILITKYKGLLESAGTCPVCHGTIDKITVDRIITQYAVS